MIKHIIIITLSVVLANCSSSRQYVKNESQNQEAENVIITYKRENDTVKISLQNKGNYTRYLFSEYLEDRFVDNRHLQSSTNDTLTISYFPFIENLGTIKKHPYVIGEDAILKYGQATYSFLEIPSQKQIEIHFSNDKLFTSDLPILLRFAIYDKVNFMNVKGIESKKEGAKLLREEANNYSTISVLVE